MTNLPSPWQGEGDRGWWLRNISLGMGRGGVRKSYVHLRNSNSEAIASRATLRTDSSSSCRQTRKVAI